MIVIQKLLIFSCAIFALCESFSVESLPKCALKDSECLRSLYQNMVRDIGKTGIPELGIPKVDPIELKNVGVSVLGLVNLTMIDGVAKGIKNCVFNSFTIDIEKEKGSQDITCDLVIKGHYSVEANAPIIKQLLGDGGLHGDGIGRVQLEKLHISYLFTFFPIRGEDGEIYIRCLYDDIEYQYNIGGRPSFAANNLYLGKTDVSDFVVNYMNENGRFLLQTFGKPFFDKAMEFYFDFAQKFFEGVPAKHYILDDLTPYIKN